MDSESVPKSNTTPPRQSLEKQYDDSPPRTPPVQIGRNGKGKGVKAPRTRPSIRDVFEDPVADSTHQNRDRSNSHGLSWSPKNARDSVVDNMLLSLDKFGFASDQRSSRGTTSYTTLFGEDPHYSPVQLSNPLATRPRGHTTSSSISSEYSFHSENPSPAQTRGHRSNSSSGFQSSLGRIDSVRVAADQKEDIMRDTGDNHTSEGAMQASNRKSGKNSVASSVDLGSVVNIVRWPPALGRRSSSFDNGYNRLGLSQETNYMMSPQDAFSYADMEAAPTPTVPVGPGRTTQSTALRPGSALSAVQPTTVRRRGNIYSLISIFDGMTNCLEALEPAQNTKSSKNLIKSTSKDANTVSQDPVTPHKANANTSQSSSNPALVKENKPGFFKRVFGSSRGAPAELTPKKQTPQRDSRATIRAGTFPSEDTVATSQPPAQQLQLLQRAPAKDKPSSKEQTQTLNKKSSFFRRRRKSLQDSSPVPQLPSVHPSYDRDTYARPELPPEHPDSPTSLRRVMDPYLDNHRRLDSVGSIGTTRRKGSFSTSGIVSTIRTVTATPLAISSSNSPQVLSRASTEIDSSAGKSLRDELVDMKRTMSGSRSSSRERVMSPVQAISPGEWPQTNAMHARNQSDVDKDLPRLPVDYNAIASEVAKEVPTSKYNTTTKPRSKDGSTPNSTNTSAIPSPEATTRQLEPLSSRMKDRAISSEQEKPVAHPARDSDATMTTYNTAPSKSQSPVRNDDDLADETLEALNLTSTNSSKITQEHRKLAHKLFSGSADIERAEIAPWLGEAGPERAKVRAAYMELFDWKDMSILTALRSFCTQIQLKGETQQVDRILDALSSRWCDCNTNHGFKATGM
jgi:hypothetical protein